MNFIKTTMGLLPYKQRCFNINEAHLDDEVMTSCFRILYTHFNKLGINWGPAFSSLIGIVRNDGYLSWANNLCIYILKEDEERFKDELWAIVADGFEVIRYERRGLYYLRKDKQYIKIFILRKIASNVRHTGGSDFIFEQYLHDTTKWEFRGMMLNVPSELDEYLTFQYGNWVVPIQYKNKQVVRIFTHLSQRLQDLLPSSVYYKWMIARRQKDFKRFKVLCEKNGKVLPDNVELTYVKQRKHEKVLTVGVYDLIHKGHAELFRRAKGLGDYLVVAVQDGGWVNKYKDTKLLNSTEDRCLMVQSIRYVDEVVVYTDVDELVKNIDFDIFVTGPDQIHAGFQRAMKWCEKNGKEHLVLGRTDGVSSSELKAKISSKTNSK